MPKSTMTFVSIEVALSFIGTAATGANIHHHFCLTFEVALSFIWISVYICQSKDSRFLSYMRAH